jgi:hypothetical protein
VTGRTIGNRSKRQQDQDQQIETVGEGESSRNSRRKQQKQEKAVIETAGAGVIITRRQQEQQHEKKEEKIPDNVIPGIYFIRTV